MIKDRVGEETEYLKVLRYAYMKNRRAYWMCECKQCGSEFEVRGHDIPYRKTCGCIRATDWAAMKAKKDRQVMNADLLKVAWI